MSQQSIVFNNGTFAIVQTDLTKIFYGGCRYDNVVFKYTNSTYNDVTIVAGTVLGRRSSDLSAELLASGASDGSQHVLGLLACDVVVLAGQSYSKAVPVCVKGDVAEEKIALQGSDTLDTLISGRPIRDLIAGETVGIKLTPSVQNTAYDNS